MRSTRIFWVLSLVPLACGGEPAGSGGTTGTSTGGPGAASTGAQTEGVTSGGGESGGESGETGAGPQPTTGAGEGGSSGGLDTGSSGDDTRGDETGAVVACPEEPLAPGEHTLTLEHDGLMRTALVHVPAGLGAGVAAPLVLNFHGYSSNAGQQQLFSAMNPVADAEGFVVVYPEGYISSWNAGVCCGEAALTNRDDVGFVRALVAELHAQLCIDPRRVYATGMSNGGFMAHRLACEASDLFAAVAPVSAVNGMNECAPVRPVPVLMFNGTLDTLVPYIGSGLFPSVAKTFAEWAARNDCMGDAQAGEAKGLASSERYEDCEGGTRVVQWTLQGMGHCWPGQALCPFGAPNLDVSANEEMWAFFQQFTLP